MSSILTWSDQLRNQFKTWDKEQQSKALFVEDHPDFPAYLLVNSFDPLYTHTLKEVIGEYRAVHKLDINKLLKAAEEYGYESIIYTRDTNELFSFLDKLDDPLSVSINVEPYAFQRRGFNYLKDLEASICNWSTGTGKSVFGVAWAKYLLETGAAEKVVVLSKSHNKYNWVNQFANIGSLDSITDEDVKGSNPAKRREARAQLYQDNDIFVINYEKLRFRPENEKDRYLGGRKMPSASGDGQELLAALKGKKVAWVLDEAPTKLKSMQTGWYKGLVRLLKQTDSNRITALTATKLEKNPEDLYAWVKILAPTIWPTKAVFRSMYAKRMFDWRVMAWDLERLPEIGMRLAHITSRADKYLDPEIRAQFPEFHHEDVYVDLYSQEHRIYEAIRNEVKNQNTLTVASLSPLQIACNNIAFLGASDSELARRIFSQYRPTDANLAKLEKLHDMLDEIPGKIVIFSAFTEFGSRMLAPYIAKWGHRFVIYDGNAKQKQDAQEKFTDDPNVRIFLSSDQGSDSINLQEASTVINFDTPWNASTFIQRQNRIHRITSEHSHVYSYTLVTTGTLEERKLAIIARKMKMEQAVDTALDQQAELINTYSAEDLWSLIA